MHNNKFKHSEKVVTGRKVGRMFILNDTKKKCNHKWKKISLSCGVIDWDM